MVTGRADLEQITVNLGGLIKIYSERSAEILQQIGSVRTEVRDVSRFVKRIPKGDGGS